MTRCKVCDYPLAFDGHCSSCFVRKSHRLPADARCRTCKQWTKLRCCRMGPNAVCASWRRKREDGNDLRTRA